ncbi:hypothetical protein OH77DRAFT_1429625 [Trametes cingulata]|nr:hypothetical protein OH77DRAFT_1429625 [Trametes cingulata]
MCRVCRRRRARSQRPKIAGAYPCTCASGAQSGNRRALFRAWSQAPASKNRGRKHRPDLRSPSYLPPGRADLGGGARWRRAGPDPVSSHSHLAGPFAFGRQAGAFGFSGRRPIAHSKSSRRACPRPTGRARVRLRADEVPPRCVRALESPGPPSVAARSAVVEKEPEKVVET